jgi:hypothetical protein
MSQKASGSHPRASPQASALPDDKFSTVVPASAVALTWRPLRASVIEPLLEILGHKAKWSFAAAYAD